MLGRQEKTTEEKIDTEFTYGACRPFNFSLFIQSPPKAPINSDKFSKDFRQAVGEYRRTERTSLNTSRSTKYGTSAL